MTTTQSRSHKIKAEIKTVLDIMAILNNLSRHVVILDGQSLMSLVVV